MISSAVLVFHNFKLPFAWLDSSTPSLMYSI